jgi:phage replication-related protein YjqB (UPF0714/DUF867 family)
MPTEATVQILKLRLPEQNELKNESERCSANPVMLESIGRSVGQQIRIRRSDGSGFVALYTVKEANPDADSSDPGQVNVVRTGQTGRERLGTDDEMEAIVQARVVDAPPRPEESDAVRFLEVAKEHERPAYFIAIAPHGGEIELHTDEQAAEAFGKLIAAKLPAAMWFCKGDGDEAKGAFDRWHITSTDLNPACFPLLQSLMSRRFCYGVAFHGFQRKEGEADVYIGGAASRSMKMDIEEALNDLHLPINVKISTRDDAPQFQGFSPENIINRLTTSGIHVEQSVEARKNFHVEIARAIAEVFVSRRRSLLCIFIKDLERQRADAEFELAQSLSKGLAGSLTVNKAIERHKAWRAKDNALAAKIKACEELCSFIEEHVEDSKTAQPEAGPPARIASNRKKGPRSRKTRQS